MIVNESGGIPNRLFFRLFQTGNILQRQVQNEMGISAVQWAVLGALSREGFEDGTSFNQLKEYLHVSRQNLDGVLKRMERDGHVVRITDPQDRRARLVVLTESGREFWNKLQDTITEFYQQALQGLSFDDGVSLLHLLKKLQRDLSGISLGDKPGQ
ncbi:MarR family transcriptional regulator [Marinobacter sp. M216]|uniref:MarR family transcriptional regulator n=1 Tax=Marinobacter albus TaxID=3030833 RepID=A0ABT7HEF2_9GAMM|nr:MULTISPECIES: MarR family transcriptional regulator [unclassified Marinobacter]MBW7471723.1 MarR family transcriptional regulator [Marinobacter sp. F4218]MDK9558292.1 MarR family transcriptional regulator [Marinobacter sp. M216]